LILSTYCPVFESSVKHNPSFDKVIEGSPLQDSGDREAACNPSILKEKELSRIAHSLTPQQAAGLALVRGFIRTAESEVEGEPTPLSAGKRPVIAII